MAGDSNPTAARRRWRIPPVLVVLLIVVSMIAAPFGLLGAMFWLVETPWVFEGEGGVRHWLFIRGKWIDRFGFVEPAGTPRYVVWLPEGNSQGYISVRYDSNALPSPIVEAYAERCRKFGLKVSKGPVASEIIAHALYVQCEIKLYQDAQFLAERPPSAERTEVNVRVWGSD